MENQIRSFQFLDNPSDTEAPKAPSDEGAVAKGD